MTAAGLAAGTLYAAGEGRVGALDTGGDPRWRIDHHAALTETVGDEWLKDSPSLFGPRAVPTPDLLYAGSAYWFHSFDPADGTDSWRVVFPNAPRSVPQSVTVTDDAVWAVADRGPPAQDAGQVGDDDGCQTPRQRRPPTGGRARRRAGRPARRRDTAPYTVGAYGPDDLGPADDPPARRRRGASGSTPTSTPKSTASPRPR